MLVANPLALDFERVTVIALSIRVSDGVLATYAMPRFDILNANDPAVILPGQGTSLLGNVPLNTEVGTKVLATDQDFGQSMVRHSTLRHRGHAVI